MMMVTMNPMIDDGTVFWLLGTGGNACFLFGFAFLRCFHSHPVSDPSERVCHSFAIADQKTQTQTLSMCSPTKSANAILFLQLSFPLGQEVPGNQLDLFLPFFFSLHTRSFFFSEFNDTRIMSQNGRRKSYEQQADYEVKSFSDSAATTSSDYGRPPRYDKTANDNKV